MSARFIVNLWDIFNFVCRKSTRSLWRSMYYHSSLSQVHMKMRSLSVSNCDLVDCFSVGIVIHTTHAEAQAASGGTTIKDNEFLNVVRQLPSDDSIKNVKMTKLEYQKVRSWPEKTLSLLYAHVWEPHTFSCIWTLTIITVIWISLPWFLSLVQSRHGHACTDIIIIIHCSFMCVVTFLSCFCCCWVLWWCNETFIIKKIGCMAEGIGVASKSIGHGVTNNQHGAIVITLRVLPWSIEWCLPWSFKKNHSTPLEF